MRLKSIKLAGFKSFVDPTTVPFPSNMCAIVGPNGCGKSNIIDAVRWVMGESSAKNLRGESMTDVIFNGSTARKPVGQASIELNFDNSDGTLGGEYASFAEISIKRKVTRDGQSEYFLNGARCRRKDITDIFLGTGLGPRSYSIIEQGMVSKLIESKPEELRVYLEEAAGISKYKERRKETEQRMKRTLENLERLTDLREELERQLQHLHRQAQAAERYTELKAEERLKRAQLGALRWRDLDRQLQQHRQRIMELEIELEKNLHLRTAAESQLEQLRLSREEVSDQFNRAQARFYETGAAIARTEQSLENLRDRERRTADELAETREQLAEAQREQAQDRLRLEELTEELLQLEPEQELAQSAMEEFAEKLAVAEEEMQNWQQEWDQFNQISADASQRAEVEQSRIRHAEQSLQRLNQTIQRMQEEEALLQAQRNDDELEELELKLEELDEQLLGAEEEQANLRESLAEERAAYERLQKDLAEKEKQLQKDLGRRASLEALQHAALEKESPETRHWLKQWGLDLKQRLGAGLRVESGWEQAVEAVLGEHLQAIQVDSLAELPGSAFGNTEGVAVEFVEKGASTTPGNGRTTLADLVQGGQVPLSLLQSVYVVEDLASALAERTQLRAHESFVTRGGDWVGAHFIRIGRLSQDGGVIERQSELASLNEQIQQLQQEIDRQRQALSELLQRIRDTEQRLEDIRRYHTQLGNERTDLKSRLSARKARLEQLQVRLGRLAQDIQEQKQHREQEEEQLKEARSRWQAAMSEMDSNADRREALLGQRDQLRLQLEEYRQQAHHSRDQAHQLQLRVQTLKSQLQSVQTALERSQIQYERLQERLRTLEELQETSREPVEELRMQLEELLDRRLEEEQRLAEAREAVEEIDRQMRLEDQQRMQADKAVQEENLRLQEQRMALQAAEIRRNTLDEQVQQDNFVLAEVLRLLPEDASEKLWEEELARIAQRIQRLGAINLAAIEEYKAQSERKTYLDAQHEDLMEALQTLEDAIRKIDRETKARFKETFDKVNESLQELFPKVFGGGTAYLELTGEDLLDTGVAIMARPPGKKNSTIHLLSGGEKALTAIALIFSIFRLNPAPFCMLDEVDAPLDDANVGRYANMVKEMSSQVQFIYISHNKIAMEKADHLMGVTMHEPGVSRLVSVDVEEAAAMAAL